MHRRLPAPRRPVRPRGRWPRPDADDRWSRPRRRLPSDLVPRRPRAEGRSSREEGRGAPIDPGSPSPVLPGANRGGANRGRVASRMTDPAGRLRRVATPDLSSTDISALRSLLWAAFPVGEEGFTEDDWLHALGGVHFVLDIDDQIVAHASVVERDLHIGDVSVRTGYVEAVAVDPARQGQGLGTWVMREVNEHIRGEYEL